MLVLTNYFLNEPQGVDPRECGIDPTKLWNIPGVSLVSTVGYGRRLDDEIAVQRARDLILEPVELKRLIASDGRCAFLDCSQYFEATGEVAIPEDLGFPHGAKRHWMSGVVNPAGRHANERWALQLAETDSSFLSDGGNAYTVGQPVLREFLREYRALPALPFKQVPNACDPVAVWGREIKKYEGFVDGFYFYAVNRERYPVKVTVALKGTAWVERLTAEEAPAVSGDSLSFELKPYDVRGFRAASGAMIAVVKQEISEVDRKHAEALAAFLVALAADAKAGRYSDCLRPEQVELLGAKAAEAGAELEEKHYWRTRTMMEYSSLRDIYWRCKKQPPNFRNF